MEELFDSVNARLSTDPYIYENSLGVWIRKNPDQPNRLAKPQIVLDSPGAPDVGGLHGAAVDAIIELKVWGYGYSMQRACYQIAAALDNLMMEPFFSDNQAVQLTTRFRSETGWESMPTTDPDTVHLANRFVARYWPTTRLPLFTQ